MTAHNSCIDRRNATNTTPNNFGDVVRQILEVRMAQIRYNETMYRISVGASLDCDMLCSINHGAVCSAGGLMAL